ncbi:MAG TPA: VWA domain-containing protein [Vicinamibacterales bacterium]|jgi:VWFA-related protein|nr:VWA domain-containing protein [Vicinamibacterales bacterium]
MAVVAGQTPAQPSASRLVSIDVVAADAKGRAVETLTPTDFEVKDAGAAQTLESARLITNETRLFAIYLDEYHIAAADTDRVRSALTRFIDQDLQPRDEIAIMKPLDSLFAIHLTDRDAARKIVDEFSGRKGDYTPRTSYERNFIAGTPARIEAARTQVGWSAINALAVHLGSLGDRRKTLIVVADGVAAPERRRGQDLPAVETVIRSANKSNVAIYTVDPREAPADDAAAGAANVLRGLPGDTDGRAIGGDLDSLSRGLTRAAADAASYYLLTYRAALPEDGKFHPVDVRVTRKDVDLRARKGYYAPSAEDALRAAVLARLTEPKETKPPEPAPHASTLIQPWFGMSRGPSGRTRVTFVWEPAVRVPGDRARHAPTRLVLTALGNDGTVLFEGTVLPTGPGVVDAKDVVGATPVRAVFDANPGRLRLRMSIQDAAADVLDRDVRDIAVRDLRGPVAIGTPEVLRARNAREFHALEGQASVPVVAREFSRMERLLIRVPVYGAGAGNVSLSAKLLSGRGSAMRDLPVTVANAAQLDEIDLPLAGLAAGEYLIDLTATGAGGEARDRLSIRVTP